MRDVAVSGGGLHPCQRRHPQPYTPATHKPHSTPSDPRCLVLYSTARYSTAGDGTKRSGMCGHRPCPASMASASPLLHLLCCWPAACAAGTLPHPPLLLLRSLLLLLLFYANFATVDLLLLLLVLCCCCTLRGCCTVRCSPRGGWNENQDQEFFI